MSAASLAAISRPFLFGTAILSHVSDPKLARVIPASRLEIRPAPEKASSGVTQIDALTGGLPRGCLTEICGAPSSGRTSLLLAALAAATNRGEICALVDAGDTFDPVSAATAEIDLTRLLWVRCREKHSLKNQHSNFTSRANRADYSILDQVLRVTDLLLQSNGFGLISLDLSNISARTARRIPLASWFRFRRAIEVTPTILMVIEQQPIAGSCSSLLLQLRNPPRPSQKDLFDVEGHTSALAQLPSHTKLLESFPIEIELSHSRLERKPPRNTRTFLRTHSAWAVS
jgi:recombination protein RecA